MFLSQHEQERLLIHVAADVARRRRERGLKLNHPEATAIITAFLLEGARDGRTVAELMDAGRRVLTRADVMDGVPEMLGEVQVERPVTGIAAEAAEVGVAAVADGDLGEQRVQRGIHEHGDHEACVVGRERRQHGADDDDGQSGLLVEVALAIVRFADPVLRTRHQTVLRILRDEVHELEDRLAVLALSERLQRRGERLLGRFFARVASRLLAHYDEIRAATRRRGAIEHLGSK